MVLKMKWYQTLFNPPSVVKHKKHAAALAAWLAVFCIPAFLAAQDTASRQEAAESIRIVLSPGSFAGVNHNDVLAAIKTWARVILKQQGVDMEVESRISDSPEELAEALRNGQTDAVSMPVDELLNLKVMPEYVFLAIRKNSFTEQYIILVHRNSGINDVHDLRGRKILLYNNPRMCLAPAWVASITGLPKTESIGMTRIDNISRTVLPVFFHQADACVVTAIGFEIACELNPQLLKDLRVLATSPEVVSSVFFFRPGYVSHVKDKLETAMLTLQETPAGQQLLMMFQGDAVVKQPISCLESSRQLWDEGGRPGSLVKGNPLVQKENTP